MERKKYKHGKKQCQKCGLWLAPSSFGADKNSWDNKNKRCKQCHSRAKIKYRKTHQGKYAMYKGNAKRRKIFFDLNEVQFALIISQPCYYCGELQENFNGIDRIDNNQGYTLENCVPCCTSCNIMKHTKTKKEFIEKCKQIVEKQEVMSYS